MAQTFSIDTQGPVQDPGPGAPATLGNVSQVSASQGVQPVQDPGMNSATTDALFKLGSDILKPRVKAAAQEQFMEGVRVAATGQALTDIIAERPWYTEVFGPSSAVQGAQTYTVATRIAKFGADMESRMPALAKQGPEAITQELQGQMAALQTGDPVADAAITSQFVDQMAPLYKRHAKEHYAFQQKEASTAQVAAWSALGSGFQQRAAAQAKGDKMVTPEDVKADADRLIGSMNPFADQGDDSYNKNVADFLAASATAGNFQVVKLFKERGLYDKIPAAQRDGLDRIFRAAGAQTLANAMPQFAMDVALTVNDTAQNPAGIAERVAKLNARAAAATGVDVETAQLIPNSTLDNVIGKVLVAQASADKTANEKQLKEMQELAVAQSQVAVPGGIAKCKAVGMCKESAVETAMLTTWGQTQDPAQRAALLSRHGSETFSGIKAEITSTLLTEEDTPGIQRTAVMYSQMSEGAKGRYFSADEQKFMDKYTRSIEARESPATAFQIAKVIAPLSKYYLDPSEKNGVKDAIRAYAEDRNENIFGWNNITDDALRVVETMVSQAVTTGRGMNSIEKSVQRGMSEALGSGRLQIIGKHAAVSAIPGQQPLGAILAQGTDRVGLNRGAELFDELLTSEAKRLGVPTKEMTIIRLPDTGGQARFAVEYQKEDGTPVSTYINSAQIKALDKTSARKAEARSTEDRTADIDWLRQRQADLNPVR